MNFKEYITESVHEDRIATQCLKDAIIATYPGTKIVYFGKDWYPTGSIRVSDLVTKRVEYVSAEDMLKVNNPYYRYATIGFDNHVNWWCIFDTEWKDAKAQYEKYTSLHKGITDTEQEQIPDL